MGPRADGGVVCGDGVGAREAWAGRVGSGGGGNRGGGEACRWGEAAAAAEEGGGEACEGEGSRVRFRDAGWICWLRAVYSEGETVP